MRTNPIGTVWLSLTIGAAISMTVAAGSCPTRTYAALLYDNGAMPNIALDSDISRSPNTLVRADDFVLPVGGATPFAVEWTGSYANGIVHNSDKLFIQFFNNEPGQVLPTAPFPPIIQFEAANPNRVDLGGGVFHYTASFNPLALSPNTRYWISILSDSIDEAGPWQWRAESTTNSADVIATRDAGPSWTNETGYKMDFQIFGIPEPASWAVMLTGSLASFLGRRQRRCE
jgi:hypothetical protein